jgi:hypothetical protein
MGPSAGHDHARAPGAPASETAIAATATTSILVVRRENIA